MTQYKEFYKNILDSAYQKWLAARHGWSSTKKVWEFIGINPKRAFPMIDGSRSESELQANGQKTAQALREGLGIKSTDKVLEVGCGVARIGREIAPYCREWWGCDISGTMINIARQRTAHLSNVYISVLPDSSLQCFADDSFDCIYCHAVFMHLDQEDIFSYVQEMRRVVKPGSIVFYDALNLNTEPGWQRFSHEIAIYEDRSSRPVHHSRFSTPQELCRYADKSQLELLCCLEPGFWVQVVATKLPADYPPNQDRETFLEQARLCIKPQSLADAC